MHAGLYKTYGVIACLLTCTDHKNSAMPIEGHCLTLPSAVWCDMSIATACMPSQLCISETQLPGSHVAMLKAEVDSWICYFAHSTQDQLRFSLPERLRLSVLSAALLIAFRVNCVPHSQKGCSCSCSSSSNRSCNGPRGVSDSPHNCCADSFTFLDTSDWAVHEL